MKTVSTYTAQIYIGRRVDYSKKVYDLEVIRNICRAYVNTVGSCVTITPTEFLYTNGGEPGAIVGLINYPRFPSTPVDIRREALNLAAELKAALEQNRVSVVFPDETVMLGE